MVGAVPRARSRPSRIACQSGPHSGQSARWRRRRTHMRLTYLSVGVLSFLAMATTARADAIDGNWCRSDGKRMSIHGSEIVTPGGTKIIGDYSRHFFSYVVPSGEQGAGNKIAITLQNEHL